MTKLPVDQDGFDAFFARTIFPNAAAIFQPVVRAIEEEADSAIVVLDTNVLLTPYTVGSKGFSEIERTLTTLAGQKRLVVPGQVAREFAKHRATKLTDLHQQLMDKKSRVTNLQLGRYPLFELSHDFSELGLLEQQINPLIDLYRKRLAKIIASVRSWNWDDPVSELYSRIFTNEVVVDPAVNDDDVIEQWRWRQQHKVPPGYKDAGKLDMGIGDYLIWLTILETAKLRRSGVFFVSADEKPDWWHQSGGIALYPRYELTYEFHQATGGQSLHIMRLSRFLELFGVAPETVEEVEREETITTAGSPLSALPNHELRDRTLTLVSRIRNLKNEAYRERDRVDYQIALERQNAKTEEERKQLWEKMLHETKVPIAALSERYDADFKAEARLLRAELVSRVPHHPHLVKDQTYIRPLAGFGFDEILVELETLARLLK